MDKEAYVALTTKIGNQIINWGRSNYAWKVSPATNWPLTDFTSAITIAICYLTFVILGRVC
jgi:hypothetical protein